MPVECTKPPVFTMHSPDFPWVADRMLLRTLTSGSRRPSLLVVCEDVAPDAVLGSLRKSCVLPFNFCSLPGALRLPPTRKGTLFVLDVSAMTLSQQIAFHDWLDEGCGEMQIISLTSRPLAPLVEQGEFVGGLFYRLNVLTLVAKRPADARTSDARVTAL
jgi:hypothetical protein